MAYLALYRKYRPKNFDEVFGQQHIVETLKNAIKHNKLAHAYLFCGPRGTGKTTVAKILAKMVNCESENERPCCICASCIDIQESAHPDVVEMDAASNNGVDEARELVEKVKYAPMSGKYKVYIIDEVHMMTTGAFNALLKTIEEPPSFCIFVLATTEPHKIPSTIISRCQRFDFKKLSKKVIQINLAQICEKEKINCSKEAISLIADLADGGMRDSLSILDQCIAYAQDDINLQDVSDVYGVATTADKIELYQLIYEKEVKKLIEKLSEIETNGIDIRRLTTDLIDIAKETVVYIYSKNMDTLSVLNEENVQKMASMFDSNTLLTYVDYLIDTLSKYRDATSTLTYLEVCLLKMVEFNEKALIVVEKEIVTKEENKPVVIEKKSYSDEEYYQMLLKATKKVKEVDAKIINGIFADNFFGKEKQLINLIKEAEIMASSKTNIILTVDNRADANFINNKENNIIVENMMEKYLPNRKDIVCITREERDFLITYFKNERSKVQKPKKATPKKKEETITPEERLTSLFGKDGFDIVGE
ncbi:MAG TPA: DNA polymerase III subunit gamma/tau [Erysipelotrichaceae bacterium]|nr:DNA polymerase III subunit gamma/tau [Erysipelotrichaceae bacterium]HQA84403.1 DNA polymerase III subunit gamma/tau [Erysipelotrichaceae bacterium]